MYNLLTIATQPFHWVYEEPQLVNVPTAYIPLSVYLEAQCYIPITKGSKAPVTHFPRHLKEANREARQVKRDYATVGQAEYLAHGPYQEALQRLVHQANLNNAYMEDVALQAQVADAIARSATPREGSVPSSKAQQPLVLDRMPVGFSDVAVTTAQGKQPDGFIYVVFDIDTTAKMKVPVDNAVYQLGQLGIPTDTYTIETGSGGQHLVCAWPAHIPLPHRNIDRVLPGVSGEVLYAPSYSLIPDGKTYVVKHAQHIAVIPERAAYFFTLLSELNLSQLDHETQQAFVRWHNQKTYQIPIGFNTRHALGGLWENFPGQSHHGRVQDDAVVANGIAQSVGQQCHALPHTGSYVDGLDGDATRRTTIPFEMRFSAQMPMLQGVLTSLYTKYGWNIHEVAQIVNTLLLHAPSLAKAMYGDVQYVLETPIAKHVQHTRKSRQVAYQRQANAKRRDGTSAVIPSVYKDVAVPVTSVDAQFTTIPFMRAVERLFGNTPLNALVLRTIEGYVRHMFRPHSYNGNQDCVALLRSALRLDERWVPSEVLDALYPDKQMIAMHAMQGEIAPPARGREEAIALTYDIIGDAQRVKRNKGVIEIPDTLVGFDDIAHFNYCRGAMARHGEAPEKILLTREGGTDTYHGLRFTLVRILHLYTQLGFDFDEVKDFAFAQIQHLGFDRSQHDGQPMKAAYVQQDIEKAFAKIEQSPSLQLRLFESGPLAGVNPVLPFVTLANGKTASLPTKLDGAELMAVVPHVKREAQVRVAFDPKLILEADVNKRSPLIPLKGQHYAYVLATDKLLADVHKRAFQFRRMRPVKQQLVAKMACYIALNVDRAVQAGITNYVNAKSFDAIRSALWTKHRELLPEFYTLARRAAVEHTMLLFRDKYAEYDEALALAKFAGTVEENAAYFERLDALTDTVLKRHKVDIAKTIDRTDAIRVAFKLLCDGPVYSGDRSTKQPVHGVGLLTLGRRQAGVGDRGARSSSWRLAHYEALADDPKFAAIPTEEVRILNPYIDYYRSMALRIKYATPEHAFSRGLGIDRLNPSAILITPTHRLFGAKAAGVVVDHVYPRAKRAARVYEETFDEDVKPQDARLDNLPMSKSVMLKPHIHGVSTQEAMVIDQLQWQTVCNGVVARDYDGLDWGARIETDFRAYVKRIFDIAAPDLERALEAFESKLERFGDELYTASFSELGLRSSWAQSSKKSVSPLQPINRALTHIRVNEPQPSVVATGATGFDPPPDKG